MQSPPDERPDGPGLPPGDNLRRLRILIAAEDPLLRALLAELIRTLGCESEMVRDGPSALTAVAARSPDLLLCDVAMPGLDGLHVCRALKGDPRTKAIPVLLLTGAGDECFLAGMEAGANGVLKKPVDAEELRRAIAALRPRPSSETRQEGSGLSGMAR